MAPVAGEEEKTTKSRKLEHLELCIEKDVGFREKTTGFEDVELVYDALPGLNKSEINTETEFFGKKFSAPIIVSGMTGGVKQAEKVNKDIAKACEELGLGMGVGSQRAIIEHPEITETYYVRDVAPNIFLAGNIGLSQVPKYSIEEIRRLVEGIKGDALALHINAAQEAVQPEGTPNFSEWKEALRKLKKLGYQFYVKEVGNGLSKEVAKKLQKTGVKALDVGGSGGTSWTEVEYLRNVKDKEHLFRDFGIPTAVSIIQCRKGFTGKIIATGGLRNGLQAAKALVLGADMAGFAQPALAAQASGGVEGVKEYLSKIIEDLKIAMFLVGAKDLKELKKKRYVLLGRTKEWVEQLK